MKNFEWIFGSLLMVGSVAILKYNGYATFVCYMVAGVLCMPPVTLYIADKVGKSILLWQKYTVIGIFIVLANIFLPQSFKDEMEAMSKAKREEATNKQTEKKGTDKTAMKEEDTEGPTKYDADGKEVGKAKSKTENIFPTDEDTKEAKIVGVKYGLQEEDRRRVFEELVWAERNATSEAEKVYDFSKMEGTARQKSETFGKYRASLEAKYKANIAQKYSLSERQIKMIYLEKIVKDWNLPPTK